MRNLKRALSLALAFVMVMSLMIVGTSAKSYTDADKIDNQVAVEILGEIGVMIGNDDGSFAPDRDVTRAEMAVILTRILYGNNMNVDQFKNMNTFTDVPDWAEGFVNLCASLDIIAGRGNGIFDPDATVTSAEAALMLSRALGYFKNNAEFGNDWALAAMKRATQVGIIGGDMVLQANAGLDRDDVAQMTFNTLTKAVPVQYNEVLDVYYNENQGVIYALEFNYLQTLGYTNFNLVYKSNQQVEYGRPATTWGIGSYKDAGNGTASGIEKADLTPAGGLIADNVRMLAKDEIITVNNTPTYVYTQDTAAKDVYADLGADVCSAYSMWNKDGYTWTAYVNGDDEKGAIPSKNDTNDYKYTDKGSVTEVYVDDYAQTVTVVEINYFLGQVSKVVDGVATVRPLSHEGKILDDKTFATSEFNKGDYVVFTVDYNNDGDYYICELMAPETMTGEVSRVQNDKDSSNAYICLDGEDTNYYYTAYPSHLVYNVSAYDDGAIKAQHPSLGKEYVFYMTPAGYILGFELAGQTKSEYLYVKDSDEELNDWVAKVILPDATEPKIDLDRDLADTTTAFGSDVIDWEKDHTKTLSNIDELIWDYSVNSNDVYSLSYVPQLGIDATVNSDLYQNKLESGWVDGSYVNIQINNGEAYIQGVASSSDFIIDNDTIFVDTMNHKAYTGYGEVPTVKNADIAYVVEDGVAEIVYIFDGDIYDENSIYFMLSSDDRTTIQHDGDDYYDFSDAYVDGVKQDSLYVSYDAVEQLANSAPWAVDAWTGKLVPGVLYQVVKSVEDGQYITEIRYAGPETNDVTAVANGSFRISTSPEGTTVNTEKFDVNDETIFVMVEPSWNWKDGWTFEIHQADASDMYVGKDHEGYKVYADVVESDGQTAELVYLTHCLPIANVDVTFKNLTNATVEVYGNHIDKTLTPTTGNSFKVQAGTWVYVKAEADEGYTFDKPIISGPYYVGWNGLTLDAATTADNFAITLSGTYADQVENTGDKVVNDKAAAKVVLEPKAGYTITGVESDAVINAAQVKDSKNWEVLVAAGTEAVDLKLTIVPDKYNFAVKDYGYWDVQIFDADGKELAAGTQLTIDQKYTVKVTATTNDDDHDGRNVVVDGQNIKTTAGGKDPVKVVVTVDDELDRLMIINTLAEDHKVYKNDGTELTAADLTSGAVENCYYYTDLGTPATANGEFTVTYQADGTVNIDIQNAK